VRATSPVKLQGAAWSTEAWNTAFSAMNTLVRNIIISKTMMFLSQAGTKSGICVAVNLLELWELREILIQIEGSSEMEILSPKEQSTFVAKLLQDAADRNGFDLKLHKKK